MKLILLLMVKLETDTKIKHVHMSLQMLISKTVIQGCSTLSNELCKKTKEQETNTKKINKQERNERS